MWHQGNWICLITHCPGDFIKIVIIRECNKIVSVKALKEKSGHTEKKFPPIFPKIRNSTLQVFHGFSALVILEKPYFLAGNSNSLRNFFPAKKISEKNQGWLYCRFFWKRLISFFLLCKNHLKNACFLWELAGFYISEKNLSGVFKKKRL